MSASTREQIHIHHLGWEFSLTAIFHQPQDGNAAVGTIAGTIFIEAPSEGLQDDQQDDQHHQDGRTLVGDPIEPR